MKTRHNFWWVLTLFSNIFGPVAKSSDNGGKKNFSSPLKPFWEVCNQTVKKGTNCSQLWGEACSTLQMRDMTRHKWTKQENRKITQHFGPKAVCNFPLHHCRSLSCIYRVYLLCSPTAVTPFAIVFIYISFNFTDFNWSILNRVFCNTATKPVLISTKLILLLQLRFANCSEQVTNSGG